MNEAETRAEHIDPALAAAGWGRVDGTQVRREYPITLGRLEPHGKRGKSLTADYVLVYRGRKLAVVEAKAWDKPLTAGLGQAKDYANRLGARLALSSNGRGVYAADMVTGQEGERAAYPSPDELWALVFGAPAPEPAVPDAHVDAAVGTAPAALSPAPLSGAQWRDRFARVPDGGGTAARYYQDAAVERVLDAVADGRPRALLTLATGTGKTFIAFQIAWKLFHARWNLGRRPTRRPRVLFLADRNILADQAFNAFSAFPEDALVRIAPNEVRKKGRVPTNGSLFFTIFQTFMSGPADALGRPSPYFGEYPRDFFDCVVVDECHRGGAQDESTWRGILEYFAPAVQIGLTATPKRRDNADTYAYFGEPVYTYSLKQGINDGYLTPFKVRQVSTTLDEYVYTPDDQLVEGAVEAGRRYTEADFNRVIEIREREAKRVRVFMDAVDQREKTLVFCATQEHALVVRDLVNQMKAGRDPDYCHRVTADDGALGDQHLRDFQDNEKLVPTVLTTSQKLSTGVDARNVRNIVLLRPVNSMIEFKQIIGRGTRLYEGKAYFTIYDFVRAHHHFADPEWDGEPLAPEPPPGPVPPPPDPLPREVRERGPRPPRIRVRLADGKARVIQHMMVTSFWHPDGTPMSAQQFLESLYGRLPAFFRDEDELRRLWAAPDTRARLLAGLAEAGFGAEQLAEMQRVIDAERSDLFDVLAHVAYARAPLRREERADQARVLISERFTGPQQAFLDFVLRHYERGGVRELDQDKLRPLLRLRYQDSITDAVADLGQPPAEIGRMFAGFQRYLYESQAA